MERNDDDAAAGVDLSGFGPFRSQPPMPLTRVAEDIALGDRGTFQEMLDLTRLHVDGLEAAFLNADVEIDPASYTVDGLRALRFADNTDLGIVGLEIAHRTCLPGRIEHLLAYAARYPYARHVSLIAPWPFRSRRDGTLRIAHMRSDDIFGPSRLASMAFDPTLQLTTYCQFLAVPAPPLRPTV